MGLEVQSVEKYGCKIITVEPSQRRVEGVIKSGAVVQVAIYTVDPFFRWPKVGENWMIRRENGTWILDSKWQENEEADTLVENLKEGDALIDTPTGNVYLSSGNSLGIDYPGDLKAVAYSTAPSGWLICEGQEVSRTTYSALFSAIGTHYGIGNGSTTFNIPDGRGRTMIGASSEHLIGEKEEIRSGTSESKFMKFFVGNWIIKT